jgi:putative ABC transport system permease protein
MKFLPLIWAGIWRKKGRAILMLLQIVSTFALFGVLQGLNTGIKQAIARTHADRLYVASSVSLGDPLPLGHLSRLEAVPGVTHVSYRIGFGGTYQQLTQFVPGFATDVRGFFAMFEEIDVPKAQIEALANTRTGAIVGKVLADRYGWKVGDRITIRGPTPKRDGSRDWPLDIVGIYTQTLQPESAIALIANYEYANEGRAVNRDTVDYFTVRVADASRAAQVGLQIDGVFANSSNETRTQSEQELAQSQVQRIGDLDFIVHGVTAAVFFALLFATGALLMQSIRERVPELAILKSVGFSDRLVMMLIVCEALVLCLLSAGIGLGLAALLLPMARSAVGAASVPGIVIAAGLGCAVVLALIGSTVPAWRGLRLQVADALADRG